VIGSKLAIVPTYSHAGTVSVETAVTVSVSVTVKVSVNVTVVVSVFVVVLTAVEVTVFVTVSVKYFGITCGPVKKPAIAATITRIESDCCSSPTTHP